MRYCVLVADDDPEQLAEVSEYLTHCGFPTVTATDGFGAIDKIITHHPSVVILDVNMPNWDGVRVSQAISNLAPGISVILMTADDDALSRASLTNCGAVWILKKPVSLPELRNFLDPGSAGQARSV